MEDKKIQKIVAYFIAAVWFVNGFFCKILNLIPRHEQIVARILGNEHSRLLILMIGFLEIGMAIWIVSGKTKQLNAVLQITSISVMNLLEFVLAPDLLLWGKFNLVFAFSFILLIYFNTFYFVQKTRLN